MQSPIATFDRKPLPLLALALPCIDRPHLPTHSPLPATGRTRRRPDTEARRRPGWRLKHEKERKEKMINHDWNGKKRLEDTLNRCRRTEGRKEGRSGLFYDYWLLYMDDRHNVSSLASAETIASLARSLASWIGFGPSACTRKSGSPFSIFAVSPIQFLMSDCDQSVVCGK